MNASVLPAAMRLYYGWAEPLITRWRKQSRLARFGVASQDSLPVVPVGLGLGPQCCPHCAVRIRNFRQFVARYDADWTDAPHAARRPAFRASATVVDLQSYGTFEAFRKATKKRRVARQAAERGYVVHPFPVEAHVYDVHDIKTSMRVRTSGPVLAYWFLRPEHIAKPARETLSWNPPACRRHWTIWWGVFRAKPEHRQGDVVVGEQLVAYVKLMRDGDVVRYADIMGHRDHLSDAIMPLLHYEIMAWLYSGGGGLAEGVRAVLYGAAEHGGEGLAFWKSQLAFMPARLLLDARPVA